MALLIGNAGRLVLSQGFGDFQLKSEQDKELQAMAMLIGSGSRLGLSQAVGAWYSLRLQLKVERDKERQAKRKGSHAQQGGGPKRPALDRLKFREPW